MPNETAAAECFHCSEKKPVTKVQHLFFCQGCLAESAECCCCGEFFPVDDHFGYCDECFSEETVECTVCVERVCQDEPCRHVFYHESEWHGCGSCEVDAEQHRDSLFTVLDRTGLAGTLKKALARHECNIRYYGPIIGTQFIEFRLDAEDYGAAFTDALNDADDPDVEERMSVGIQWLVSLQPGKTEEADDLTAKWIDEWTSMHDSPSIL